MPKWVVPKKKNCPICGKEFYDYANTKYCGVECADVVYREQLKAKTKEYRKKYPERYRKGGRYYKLNSECRKRWYEKNKEKMRQYNIDYRAKHREEINIRWHRNYIKRKEEKKDG